MHITQQIQSLLNRIRTKTIKSQGVKIALKSLAIFWGSILNLVLETLGKFLHIKLIAPFESFIKTSGLFKFYTLAGMIVIIGLVIVSQLAFSNAWGV